MTKFLIVMQTKAAGMPHNIRLETAADSPVRAKNNALYLLRKYGQDVFNVSKRAFSPQLREFSRQVSANREATITVIDSETDERWIRSLNLRAYIPEKDQA